MALRCDNRVLVVDDSPVYRHLISGHLRDWGFEVIFANNGEEGWKVLQHPGGPTLALLDWVMPGMDGVELCRKVREIGSADSYVYIVLLTGKDSHSDLLKGLEAGADDYLVKPFEEQELKARLLVGKRILGLQQELVHARESMSFSASHDGLTGLINRTEIVKALQRELDRSRRDKRPLTVMMADVDHFKKINDELGHPAGDEVLTEVGRRLKSEMRTYDAVGSYGGEEFLVLMPGCDSVAALIRADQIRSAVSAKPIGTSAKARRITLSMGVAVTDGSKQVDVQSVLHQADLGLYKAKKDGRNRVEQVDEVETATFASPQR
jgi:two-component system, cell cycle response regulator